MAANTPENKVKAKIDEPLLALQEAGLLWFHRAVQEGMGRPTLDYTGCCCGRYFAIEAKAPGKKLTKRQHLTAAAMRSAGGVVFEIDCEEKIPPLVDWLMNTIFENPDAGRQENQESRHPE